MPTMAEHRADYDDFVATVHELCLHPGIRKKLRTGRGRPVEECALLHSHLRRTIRKPGRRAYYTTASLIAQTAPHHDEEHDEDTLRPGAPAAPGPALTIASAAPPSSADPAAHDWFSRPNLGATLAAAVLHRAHDAQRTGDRLHLLNRLSDDQLHRRLPQEVTRLQASGLTPDWGVLLHDLVQRAYHREKVALRWSDAFYLTLEDHLTP